MKIQIMTKNDHNQKEKFPFYWLKCEIETPQFLGCQEKYYMFRQSGWYNILTGKFKTDGKVKGSHDVWGFTSFLDFQKRLVRYL